MVRGQIRQGEKDDIAQCVSLQASYLETLHVARGLRPHMQSNLDSNGKLLAGVATGPVDSRERAL